MDDLLAEFERPRQATPEDKDRRRRLFAAFGIAGLSLVALGSLTTNALFTDTDSVDSSSFTSGTIDIAAGPATVNFNAANMAPGDSVFGDIDVTNSGTLQLRYAGSASATDPDSKALRSQLQFSVFSDVTAANCNAGDVSGGTQLDSTTPVDPSRALFGDPTQGAQPGDRTLNAGVDEHLCVRATLPLATDNAYQGATTVVTFTFRAEQTAHNS